MKTVTVTFHAEHNYGAVLQAYALQKYLLNSGFDNEIIDIRHSASVDKIRIFKKVDSCRDLANNFFSLLRYKSLKVGLNRFIDFVDCYQNKTHIYNSISDLIMNPPNSDVYICGSDQIWNISNVVSKEFFLQFGGKKVRRISYAASFGVSEFNDEKMTILADYLKDFDAISVREKSGVDLLYSKLSYNATRCIDPVFLLHDCWSELSRKAKNILPDKKYILVYSLYNNDLMKNTIKKSKRKYGYEIVQIGYKGYSPLYHDKMILNAGPLEFISLIKNAQAVITSSFHGTAFSIIFKKPFLAVVNPLVGSRIMDLLSDIGLQDRIVNDEDQYKSLMDISFRVADVKLQDLISSSKDFLSKAIEG